MTSVLTGMGSAPSSPPRMFGVGFSGGLVERSAPHYLQHVNMTVACGVIYSQVVGARADEHGPARNADILNDVAHALSMVATIYARDTVSGDLRQVPALDLLAGKFSQGARRFTMANGVTLDDLTVQRGEMFNAIRLFRAMRLAFPSAP